MNQIASLIIQWYRLNKRDLPWRNTFKPYEIWLSETILQQTRVAQGLAYYHRFLERFPTISHLAKAEIDEVLEVWQGLGYYSRARNMHETARFIEEQLEGKFPGSYLELIKLKGVGKYTAAAISSFAFFENRAVVDGNVVRVLSRVYQIEEDIRLQPTRDKVEMIANEILSPENPYEFNQGIMEIGALICLPKNPSCNSCPIQGNCISRSTNSQNRLPFKSKAKPKKNRFLNYLLIENSDSVFFSRRSKKDIWEGLYEPILFESDRIFNSTAEFLEYFRSRYPLVEAVFEIVSSPKLEKHLLTHQILWVSILHVKIEFKPDFSDGKWVKWSEFETVPKPVIFSKFYKKKDLSELPLIFKK